MLPFKRSFHSRAARRFAGGVVLLTASFWLGSSRAAAGPAASAVTEGGQIPVANLKNGNDVYVAVCASCHDSGVAGAPKTGDKAAWAARLAEGMGLLYLHSLKGYHGKAGVMPARGGRADLPVELVKEAVDYMVSRSN
jgi:cytochrome c5